MMADEKPTGATTQIEIATLKGELRETALMAELRDEIANLRSELIVRMDAQHQFILRIMYGLGAAGTLAGGSQLI